MGLTKEKLKNRLMKKNNAMLSLMISRVQLQMISLKMMINRKPLKNQRRKAKMRKKKRTQEVK